MAKAAKTAGSSAAKSKTSTKIKRPAPKTTQGLPTGTAHKVVSRKRGHNNTEDSEIEEVQPPKKKPKTDSQRNREKEKRKAQRKKKNDKEVVSGSDDDEAEEENDNDSTPSQENDWVDEEPSPQDEPPADLTQAQRAEWIKVTRKLRAKRSTWKSEWYEYYEYMPSVDVSQPGNPAYKFRCKLCGLDVRRTCTDNGSSNLKRHTTERCTKRDGQEGGEKQTTLDEQFSRYTYGELRYLLAEWVTLCHRPDVIVEDEPFKRIVSLLNPTAKLPSADTLRRDISEMFEVSREGLIEILDGHEGRFNLVFDAWTSPNHCEFLGIGVSFAFKGSIAVVVLDMFELTESHTGGYLAQTIYDILEAFKIASRTLGETGDNASNNDKALDYFERLLPREKVGDKWERALAGRDTQIRCFAHILNLVYEGTNRGFNDKKPRAKRSGPRKEREETPELDGDDEEAEQSGDQNEEDGAGDDLEDEEHEEGDWENLPDADVEEDDIEEDTDDELDRDDEAGNRETRQELRKQMEEELDELADARSEVNELSEEEERLGCTAMKKLVLICQRVFNKDSLQRKLRKMCQLRAIPPRKLIKRATTRWNTMSHVIERALYLRRAIDSLVMLPEVNKGRPKSRLRHLKLSNEEWRVFTELQVVLKKLEQTTLKISHSKFPLLPDVIPYIDWLTNEFEKLLDDTTLLPCIRAAIARALSVLDKYYSKTDESIMWKSAMILHPRYKTAWFRDKDWQSTWITTAVDSLTDVWKRYYKPKVTVKLTASTDDPIDSVENYGINRNVDAFEAYISSPQDGSVKDPIQYWSSRLPAATTTERTSDHLLAQMSLDFLSAPAASTDIERLFSHGGLVVTKRRHALKPESVRASTVLQSWLAVGNIVPKKALVKSFNNKQRRKKDDDDDVIEIPDVE